MNTTKTNQGRSVLSVCIAGMLAAVASGCGAAAVVPMRNMHEVVYDGVPQGERYAIALEQTLDLHEAEVNAAFDRTYPSIIEANAASHEFVRRDLHPALAERLQALGLTQRGFVEYAAQHPVWATEQSRFYEARMSSTRGIAFAIISRVGPTDRGPLALPPVGEPLLVSTAVAAR